MFHCFCDFDGTITLRDTTDAVLEKFADPLYLKWEERWIAGEITAKECMEQQARLIREGPGALQEFVRSIPIDLGIHALIDACRRLKGGLTIVSDGIDFLMEEVLRAHRLEDLPHYSNRLQWDRGGGPALTFPFARPDCRGGCGLCKCSLIEKCTTQGVWTVFIGDGLSDRCAVHQADQVFAKGKLRSYCLENGIAHIPFESLSEVAASIVQMARA